MILAGGALGFLYVWNKWDELALRDVSLAPVISGNGAYGVDMRIRF